MIMSVLSLEYQPLGRFADRSLHERKLRESESIRPIWTEAWSQYLDASTMDLHGDRQGCRQGIPRLIGGKLDSGRVFGFLL